LFLEVAKLAKADGYIGADVFAQRLITLDFRKARMSLTRLPAQTGALPSDRVISPELADYIPIFAETLLKKPAKQNIIIDDEIALHTLSGCASHSILVHSRTAATTFTKLYFSSPIFIAFKVHQC
jgi:hypothetical protein